MHTHKIVYIKVFKIAPTWFDLKSSSRSCTVPR